MPLTRLARTEEIALRTAQRWLQRYHAQGLAGLAREVMDQELQRNAL